MERVIRPPKVVHTANAPALARVDVLGVHVSAIDMPLALEAIDRWITRGDHAYVCVTGVHGIMESQRDRQLLDIHNRAGLTTPDGMPLVWAGRAAGARHIRRVCGPDLLPAVCGLAEDRSFSCYFYGGRPGVAEQLAARMRRRYPGLRVAGTYAPPFRESSDEEDANVVRQVNRVRPNVVWVGLSTPKQEHWMAAHIHRLDANVLIGVGAAFDIHAGLSPRAPRWIQRSGLEWSYRMVHEPRRLWRRYARVVPAFLIRLAVRPPRLIQQTAADNEPVPERDQSPRSGELYDRHGCPKGSPRAVGAIPCVPRRADRSCIRQSQLLRTGI